MKLVEFTAFKPFNHLRNNMQANAVQYQAHNADWGRMTLHEKSLLKFHGLQIGFNQLETLWDKTLSYKLQRVLVLSLTSDFKSCIQHYHVAQCPKLMTSLASCDDSEVAVIATSTEAWWFKQVNELLPRAKALTMCDACLQEIKFQGFHESHSRRRKHSTLVMKGFKEEDYFRQFPQDVSASY